MRTTRRGGGDDEEGGGGVSTHESPVDGAQEGAADRAPMDSAAAISQAVYPPTDMPWVAPEGTRDEVNWLNAMFFAAPAMEEIEDPPNDPRRMYIPWVHPEGSEEEVNRRNAMFFAVDGSEASQWSSDDDSDDEGGPSPGDSAADLAGHTTEFRGPRRARQSRQVHRELPVSPVAPDGERGGQGASAGAHQQEPSSWNPPADTNQQEQADDRPGSPIDDEAIRQRFGHILSKYRRYDGYPDSDPDAFGSPMNLAWYLRGPEGEDEEEEEEELEEEHDESDAHTNDDVGGGDEEEDEEGTDARATEKERTENTEIKEEEEVEEEAERKKQKQKGKAVERGTAEEVHTTCRCCKGDYNTCRCCTKEVVACLVCRGVRLRAWMEAHKKPRRSAHGNDEGNASTPLTEPTVNNQQEGPHTAGATTDGAKEGGATAPAEPGRDSDEEGDGLVQRIGFYQGHAGIDYADSDYCAGDSSPDGDPLSQEMEEYRRGAFEGPYDVEEEGSEEEEEEEMVEEVEDELDGRNAADGRPGDDARGGDDGRGGGGGTAGGKRKSLADVHTRSPSQPANKQHRPRSPSPHATWEQTHRVGPPRDMSFRARQRLEQQGSEQEVIKFTVAPTFSSGSARLGARQWAIGVLSPAAAAIWESRSGGGPPAASSWAMSTSLGMSGGTRQEVVRRPSAVPAGSRPTATVVPRTQARDANTWGRVGCAAAGRVACAECGEGCAAKDAVTCCDCWRVRHRACAGAQLGGKLSMYTCGACLIGGATHDVIHDGYGGTFSAGELSLNVAASLLLSSKAAGTETTYDCSVRTVIRLIKRAVFNKTGREVAASAIMPREANVAMPLPYLLCYLGEAVHSYSTQSIRGHLSAIGRWHIVKSHGQLISTHKSWIVTEVMASIARVHGGTSKGSPKAAFALPVEVVEQVILTAEEMARAALLKGDLRQAYGHARDALWYTVTFIACLRKQESVRLRRHNFTEGVVAGTTHIFVQQGKTDQLKVGVSVPVSNRSDSGALRLVDMLELHREVLRRMGVSTDVLFGWMDDPQQPLASAGSILERMKEVYLNALEAKGLIVPDGLRLSGHSFRRGGICAIRDAARAAGVSDVELTELLLRYGRWKDPLSLRIYLVDNWQALAGLSQRL